jgi:hypothetical protein
MNNKIIGLLGAFALAGLVAGCGSTNAPIQAPSHNSSPKVSPKASPSAKATPTQTTKVVLGSKLPSLATITSNSFTFTMPAVDLTTAQESDPNLFLMAGRSGAAVVTLPSDWEDYVPNIAVTNDTNGAVSNATAQTWAEDFLKVEVLKSWAEEYADSELLENITAPSGSYFYGGSSVLQEAIHGTTNVYTGDIFPSHLYLVSMNTAESQAAFGVSSPYALVAVVPSGTTGAAITTTKAGVVSKLAPSKAQAAGYLVSGNYATEPASGSMPQGPTGAPVPWAFGPVFNVTGSELCTSNAMAGTLCGDAGVN